MKREPLGAPSVRLLPLLLSLLVLALPLFVRPLLLLVLTLAVAGLALLLLLVRAVGHVPAPQMAPRWARWFNPSRGSQFRRP